MSKPIEDNERLAETLEATGQYRVSRIVPPAARETFMEAEPGVRLRAGVILDTETTGVGPEDVAIQLGLIRFRYDESGIIYSIDGVCEMLEDPGRPIPAEATAVHGITDAMVAGQRFEDARVVRYLQQASIVIAHNAAFDRPMIEKRYPEFAGVPWGCTYADIDWRAAGYSSRSLEFLLFRCGRFNSGAHGALADCRATLELLRVAEGFEAAPLALVARAAAAGQVRLWASGAPFDVKDQLKARGYRFEQARKTWYVDLPATGAETERAWLSEVAYAGKSPIVWIETIGPLDRFAGRVTDGRNEALV